MFCWFFRLMISHAADANTHLSERTKKHIRRCTGCRQFQEACLSLKEGLRCETTLPDEQFSGRMHERFVSALSAGTPGRLAGTYKLVIKWRPVIAAAASLTVLASIGILFFTRTEKVPHTNQYAEGKKIISDLVAEQFLEALPKSVENPLADELENLTRDTESAVRFLVACVAVHPAEAANKSIN